MHTNTITVHAHHVHQDDWRQTYSVAAFKAACRQELDSTPTSTYSRRIHDSLHAYHTRDFVHRVPPVRPLPRPWHDASVHVQPRGSGTPWVGRFAPYVPEGNLENGTGAVEAQRAYHLDAARDRMRVMYIKSSKVGGTTLASLFARLAVTRGMTRVHPDASTWSQPFDIMYAHNFFHNGKAAGQPQVALTCHVSAHTGVASSWCGGYQPWMDYHVPRAWRVVMAREPMARTASLYYYLAGYTTTKNRLDEVPQRFNASDVYALPQSKDGRAALKQFLQLDNQLSSWDRVQWHWLREGTPNRSLDEVIEMLLNGAFLVGLTEHFDESLVLWRHCMGLFVEDILYFKLNDDFAHPSVREWHYEEQLQAKRMVESTGDTRFYAAAKQVFEHQVTVYGGWDKLRAETSAFRAVNKRLNDECSSVMLEFDMSRVYQRAVCLVAKYREHGLAAQFGEA